MTQAPNQLAMSRKIIDEIVLGKQRYAMADLVVGLAESARDDMLPFATVWEFFQHIVIIRKMYEMHERGQQASIEDLSRLTTIPGSTMQQRLGELLDCGAIEPRGPRYMLTPAFFNSEFMLRGFRLRRMIVTIAPEKMADTNGEDD
jgi:hypothetical protein